MAKDYFINAEGNDIGKATEEFYKNLVKAEKTLKNWKAKPLPEAKNTTYSLFCEYEGKIPEDHTGITQGVYRSETNFAEAQKEAKKVFGKKLNITAATIKAEYGITAKQQKVLLSGKEKPPGEGNLERDVQSYSRHLMR